ncbi:hypothetical protein VCRA2119O54_30050 [Vibrio crassostreae]|nr:hypothetical protein VCRA2117O378_130072 [Vibrio crassostreae]CAK1781318.1 hypothetical protein VCRA2113O199_150063 [Vibrio crassostreae]CAK1796008.1 hypothetical protein VCRA2113O354_160064 [Vibrio crassostreae]CAK2065456.1 hypothetical protein VCRA2119O45_30050 [Vibrio crassostreae]CAK2500811.1 hypothetical protein VCRA2119O54_30050 [Vibrio crassostreae]
MTSLLGSLNGSDLDLFSSKFKHKKLKPYKD